MKTCETRQAISPGDVTGARTALIRGLQRFEEDDNVEHLLTGAETALAHLGITIEEEAEK